MSVAGAPPGRAPLAAPAAPAPAPAAAPLGVRGYVSYGVLRGPLALLELPLFVLLPTFYAETLGVDLTLVGAILFFTRLVDAVADPTIGVMLDARPAPTTYRRWILWALPVLVLGYAAVFSPPAGVSLPAWLAIASVVTYLAYSVVSIAYQAWGSRLGSTPVERVRVTASREAFGLLGVLLSASLLLPERVGWLVLLFAVGAALAAAAISRAPLPPAPAGPAVAPPQLPLRERLRATWRDVSGSRPFRWMLAAFMINGVATAIPATLVLFYIGDVLQSAPRAPMFLVAYFLAAAVGMPVWVRIARVAGLRNAWLFGMALAVFAFVWAFGLGAGDTTAFLVVCLVTGFALGADLAVPPALLANALSAEDAPKERHGAFFGVWNLATKINLAAAAGLALPLLGLLGYTPGSPPGHTIALSATYALLPSALKLLAGFVLVVAPLPPDDRPAEVRPR